MNKTLIIPKEVDSKVFARLAEKDEKTALVLELESYGGLGVFRYRGRRTRSYIFRYDKNRGRHTLRIPQSVAMANDKEVLKDIFDQRPMPMPVIPTVEAWDSKAETGREGPAQNPHAQVHPQLEKVEEPAKEEAPAVETPEAPHISASATAAELLGVKTEQPEQTPADPEPAKPAPKPAAKKGGAKRQGKRK